MSAAGHDPLCGQYCPSPDLSWISPGASLPKCRGGDCTLCDEMDCTCSLIAQVRADERNTCPICGSKFNGLAHINCADSVGASSGSIYRWQPYTFDGTKEGN